MFTISVIIPNYNNSKYLAQCIDSVLNQTYPIKEIVIYDDCSTDESKTILDKYSIVDNRINVIYGKKNIGVSSARDIAIKNTTSDYVCMIDADDYFFSNKKIEEEMRLVEKIYEESQKKVVVFSQTIDVNEEGSPFKNPRNVDLNGNEKFKIVTRLYNKYMPRDYCFPREYYDQCGGYTKGLSLYEDWELNIKLTLLTDFVYSNHYGTAYRHKAFGLSSIDGLNQLKTKISIIKKYKVGFVSLLVFYFVAYAAFIKKEIRKLLK